MKKSIISVVSLGIILGMGILFLPGNDQSSEERTAKIITHDKPIGGNFTITTASGELSLRDLQGQLVLLYFGYTFCPDICPTNLSSLFSAYRQLSTEEQEQVQIVFISVDPNRDTPERLGLYSDYFQMNMISGTSDKENLINIAKNYGVVFVSHQESETDLYYAVDHSAFTYLIDKKGQLKTQLPHATTPEQFIEAIRNHL